MPFTVTLRGPAGESAVDWRSHPWEGVVARGLAGECHVSPPLQLTVSSGGATGTLHYRCGWVEEASEAGIYLHRHPRQAKVVPMPFIAGSGAALYSKALGRFEAGSATSGGHWKSAYNEIQAVYGGRFPIAYDEFVRLDRRLLRSVMAEGGGLCVIVSSHDCKKENKTFSQTSCTPPR